MTITPTACTVDYRIVPFVTAPGAPIRTDATFVVTDGNGHVRRV